jgi:hypothetical protein
MMQTDQTSPQLSHTGNPYDPVTAILYGQFIQAAYGTCTCTGSGACHNSIHSERPGHPEHHHQRWDA